MSDGSHDEHQEVAAAAVVGAVAAGVGVGAGPIGAVVAAGAGQAAQVLLGQLSRRRLDRAEAMVLDASTRAELDVDELIARLSQSGERETLLVRAILAASSARLDEHVLMLADALARGALANDDVHVGALNAYVAALSDLGPLELHVLTRFTKTSSELGLGDSSDLMSTLNEAQLRMALADIGPSYEPAMALLERHGLIARQERGSGVVLGGGVVGGSSPAHYRITPFGEEMVSDIARASASLVSGTDADD